jgi:hypothetical protein
MTDKAFLFIAAEMRAQLPMKMTIDDFDCWDGKKGMKVVRRIGVALGVNGQERPRPPFRETTGASAGMGIPPRAG